ncbi:hypothetical protein KBX17_08760 [Corynebacterium sp. CCUG 65737]|uniref:hypothetical protein n=1 Tax=Corynebacterium sp. CCUG 65737 TaxID=2823889 RepID=UPI00210C0E8D|nr:hypothetical protein [Corynebacterium sp. CCUG 65737]MCQ4627887.1 hypothetical protein [Corynebacterium sp. CCUG 65737]
MSGGDNSARFPVERALLVAWGVFLVGSLTWPFLLVFGGGSLALRDMMVLPRPYLTHASLGFGDLPGRNAPQDAVLAVVGAVVPATWFVALFMVAAAGAAAWVGARSGRGLWSSAAAMTIAVWNPFVVERLLQGQWSLAAAAWLLPAVALCRGPGQILAMWSASLTPTGGLFALLTGVAVNRRWHVAVAGVVGCLPWVVPSVLSLGSGTTTATAASATAFAPRAETYAGTLGTLMGLGGIWNGDAAPASRQVGFALVGVLLFALLCVAARRVPRPLLILAGIGFAVSLVSWLLPGAMGWLVSTIPGGGLLRDAQKFTALALPAFIVAAASLRVVDLRLPAVALVLALLQVPDAPRAVALLAPVEVAVPEIDHRGRDVFFVDRPTLLTRSDGIPVIDPATKAMNVVESGSLVVDGTETDIPSPRWRTANEIFAGAEAGEYDPATARYYSDPEVGLVVRPDANGFTVEDAGLPARKRNGLGLGLLALWFAVPLLGLAARGTSRRDAFARRRRLPEADSRHSTPGIDF